MPKSKRYNHCFLAALFLSLLPASQVGAEESQLTGDIFGGQGGYFHPYISLAGLYDDNVYNTSDNTVGDSGLVTSPGIWIAVPGTRERILNLETSNVTPGGIAMHENRGRRFKNYQGYLHYGADLTRYNEESEADTDDQQVEGFFQYNLKGGLSFSALNVFLDSHDDWNEGVSMELDTFTSNVAGVRVSYDFATRFNIQADYSNFIVSYDDDRNQLRDRTDNTYSSALYYHLSTKTAFFAEYDFLTIAYDTYSALDSDEHHMFGGIRWDVTDKTLGEAKFGYLNKQYDNPLVDDGNDFIMQGWMDYEISKKTKLKLIARRTMEEPNSYDTDSITADTIRLQYRQEITGKIDAKANLGYLHRDYEPIENSLTDVSDRDEDEYSAGLALEYKMKRWFSVVPSYNYFKRESTVEERSYDDNIFLLRLSLFM